MTSELPPELTAAADRVTSPPDLSTEPIADVTGELHRLLSWWHAVGGAAEPLPAIVEDGSGPWLDSVEAIRAGLAAADAAVDTGANLLIPRVMSREDVAARTIIAVLTRSDAPALVPQAEGLRDAEWMATVTSVRDDAYRVAEYRGAPVDLLDAAGAPSIAFVVGVLIGASSRQTPCLIDGTDELAAALVADRITMTAKLWWRTGSQSADPARAAAAERADLERGLPLALTDDRGLGADATLALLRLLTSEG